jgi:hypothetical protein
LGQEGESVRRLLKGVIALWLVTAGVLALTPTVSAAGSIFAGTWVSTDTDGSTQTLAIGRGPTPAVTYEDFSARFCVDGGAPSSHFVATGQGAIDDATLWVAFRNGGCGRFAIGPFGLGFRYDSSTDTLTDDFGITWHRSP